MQSLITARTELHVVELKLKRALLCPLADRRLNVTSVSVVHKDKSGATR